MKELLSSLVDDTGQYLANSKDAIAVYAAERTAILATLVGQVGYAQAVIVERDNLALFMGLEAVSNADGLQDRILGALQGALFVGASAISATDEGL